MSQANLDHPQAEQPADADQIDVIGGSQDHLDSMPAQFHDAQDLPAEREDAEPLVRDRSSQLALNVVDSEHKRNKVNSLLARIREDIDTLKEEMLTKYHLPS